MFYKNIFNRMVVMAMMSLIPGHCARILLTQHVQLNYRDKQLSRVLKGGY